MLYREFSENLTSEWTVVYRDCGLEVPLRSPRKVLVSYTLTRVDR